MSHIKIWTLLVVAGAFSAWIGMSAWSTAADCAYFSGTALLAHWVWGPSA